MLKKTLYALLALFVILTVVMLTQVQEDIPFEQLKEKYTNDASRFIQIDDMQVHFRDEGEGAPLVLLHGTGASLHTWDGWVKELSSEFRIIRMDLPAFGLTGPNKTHDYSIQNYVNFLDRFLTYLKVDSFYIAGNSLGGRIAWTYTLEFPTKVRKMILLDAAGYPSPGTPFVFRLAQIPLVNNVVRHITPRNLVEKSLLDVYADDSKVTPELVERYYEFSLREGNREAFIARAKTKFVDRTLELKSLQTPALVLWGAEDKWTLVENAHRFEADLPNARLIVYEDVGHVPMEEIPRKTAIDARAFLVNQ